MIKLLPPIKNVYVLIGNNQYSVSSTFMRLQAFYESALPNIKEQYFTLEQFMDSYAKEYGDFTYTSDFDAFNIPGHIASQFFCTFSSTLLEKERKLKSLLHAPLTHYHNKKNKFYVIGIYDIADLQHELAHAFYYLYPEYRNAMNGITCSIPTNERERLSKTVQEWGYYCDDVVLDEIQAYMGTSGYSWLLQKFGVRAVPIRFIRKYQRVFKNTISKHC